MLAELELSRPMLPGKTELEQLELICRVMGTPTEATWPGLSSLPNYETLLAGMTKFSVTFRYHPQSNFVSKLVSRIGYIFYSLVFCFRGVPSKFTTSFAQVIVREEAVRRRPWSAGAGSSY